jgi:hypothetical protein
LIDEGFLKKTSLDQLFRPGETASGEKTQFALGFRVISAEDGKVLIGQPGGGIGITSILFLDRQNKIAIAILTNQTGSNANRISLLRGIADSFSK